MSMNMYIENKYSIMQHSWEETVEIIQSFDQHIITFKVFNRTREMETKYSNLNSHFRNIRSSIELFFTPKITLSHSTVKITRNKYPYNFSDNIEHYIVWTEDSISDVIESFKAEGLFEFDNFVVFSNSPELRSIKRNHHHLLIRE